ncbi:MAG: ribosome maturation factor RimM [Actinomycetota bacterium]|jgi:16S rRNA processing protein RimM|nr:ribosome maturation factor RimM [Actinomycetota bacterium]
MTDRNELSSELSDPVVIGVISTPHGVRGTLRVKPVGSGLHLRKGESPVVGDRRRTILGARQTPKGFLVDFEGISSREEADAMRGAELFLDRDELDEPDEGEFYVSDLVGLEALDESGEKVGTVAETFETAAHEILVIREDGEEIYVPFTMEHVPEINLEAGRITIAQPEE